jgi:uncharacterized protein YecT (DUF1311 family)
MQKYDANSRIVGKYDMNFSSRIIRSGQICSAYLIFILALNLSVAERGHAQSRKPTAQEVAAIETCTDKNKDNIEEGERQCLFKLVADRCIGDVGDTPSWKLVDCYRIEGSIWDDLLNRNYKRLLDTLDDEQTTKARAMQRAWIAYRNTTCQFYWDKIRGTMANSMQSACAARESARRAMLLDFFVRF